MKKLFFILIPFFICSIANAETFEKVDDNTVKIISISEKTVAVDDLNYQLGRIRQRKEAQNLLTDAEIARIEAQIGEAKKLGVEVSDKPSMNLSQKRRGRRQ
jgi:hypothetical protein